MDLKSRPWGRWLLSVVLFSGLSLAAADLRAQDRYPGEGRVLGMDEEKRMLFIAHGPIPGFMPAPMRHGFTVHRVELLQGLRKGDTIRFVLEVKDEVLGISTIEKTEESK